MRRRFIWRDGEVVEVSPETEVRSRAQIISDIEPFKSPIDGSVIGSRPAIREHERRHGVKQVGNDYVGEKPPSWWNERKPLYN